MQLSNENKVQYRSDLKFATSYSLSGIIIAICYIHVSKPLANYLE